MRALINIFLKHCVLVLVLAFYGCSSGGSGAGSCPGSIISSCVDVCPENCPAQGLTEVCVGSGYEPNRCCYCE